MAFRLFERQEHSALYQKYMVREPEEVQRLILAYLEEKKGRPFGLAVDVGCGTGQSSRVLAPHFQKVVGVDISESQIQEANQTGSFPNVSYLVATAEKLPFEGDSVDLITASVAAHWFNMEEFLSEVDHVLKPNGCLAMYCQHPHYDLHYNDCSESLTATFMEAVNFILSEYGSERMLHLQSEYKEIFNAVPFADKTRVTGILLKRCISLAALLGYIESTFCFQNFLLTDPEAAKEFMQKLQERLLKTMEASSADTELEICNRYCCVLACKST